MEILLTQDSARSWVGAHPVPGGDDRQRILNAGCVAYITKPFDTRTLVARIEPFLKPRP